MCSTRKQSRNAFLLGLSSVLIIIVTRAVRRWNQTGQKFAGEPDIARTFFSAHRHILWILVGFTYLWNLQSLASRGFPQFPQMLSAAIATGLATAALTFKLAFTHEDSPELMAGIARHMADNAVGVSLLARARVVFAAIALTLFYTIGSGFGHKRPNRRL